MITPRRTRLVRVPNLQAFRAAIASLAASSETQPALVIVPTRSAAHQLSKDSPNVLTRGELYFELQTRLSPRQPWLSAFEREGIMHAAAAAHAEGLPFKLRPGLVAEMLRFYDQLRRQSQSVQRFGELMEAALGGAEAVDRGSARMLQQTAFLSNSFREYERLVAATGALDEHGARARLVVEPTVPPVRQVVVTVADWIADPDGLFVADFDLLSRMPGLESLDLVCTERVLESGFHERLHSWWPGIEEISARDVLPQVPHAKPTLVSPLGADDNQPWFIYRDREEELNAIGARRKGAEAVGKSPPLDRVAVVFKRPLPYLYLAPWTLGSQGVAFQTADAFPLAAEPEAATVNLILDCAESEFTRTTLVALLRSPSIVCSGQRIPREATARLDRALAEARYLGDVDRLEPLADRIDQAARPAFEAAVAIARELLPLVEPAPASTQLRRLIAVLDEHLSPLDEADSRDRRARTAVRETLEKLAAAHAAHYDPPWSVGDLAASVRRWIGEQTFASSPGGNGVWLLDDRAARYGEFDEVSLVGLIESEWPERARRNIFYPAALLKALGWPTERDRRAAADASVLDLVASASQRVFLSTFTLEDEALVTRSIQLDEIPRAKLSVVQADRDDSPAVPDVPDPMPREWLDLRMQRTSREAPAFHGYVGPREPRTWSVSALETYLECPFKFFARHVLRLQEEPEDEEVMDPRKQGQFVHAVFEEFFREWQTGGRAAITSEVLDEARALFTRVVDRLLEGVPVAEANLERTRLLGSSAAAGLGEAVLRMEAERSTPVVDRLLEHKLSGSLTIEVEGRSRSVTVRGKADRLDLLADGTFRVIDYKLGWPPNRARALQLPIYGLLAERALAGRGGKAWQLGEAVYLAFKGPKRVVPLFGTSADREEVLAEAQQRLANTIDAIERGEFPPTPDDVFRCESCSFAAVCRKDYVGDV